VTVIGFHTVKQTEALSKIESQIPGQGGNTVSQSKAGPHLPHRIPPATLQSAILKQLVYQIQNQDSRMLALMIICILLASLQVQSYVAHGKYPVGREPSGSSSSFDFPPPAGGLRFRTRRSVHLPASPLSTHAKKDVLPVQVSCRPQISKVTYLSSPTRKSRATTPGVRTMIFPDPTTHPRRTIMDYPTSFLDIDSLTCSKPQHLSLRHRFS
ncbi:hypothetical protein PSHT_00136, partial [Puccinia striiformis]